MTKAERSLNYRMYQLSLEYGSEMIRYAEVNLKAEQNPNRSDLTEASRKQFNLLCALQQEMHTLAAQLVAQ